MLRKQEGSSRHPIHREIKLEMAAGRTAPSPKQWAWPSLTICRRWTSKTSHPISMDRMATILWILVLGKLNRCRPMETLQSGREVVHNKRYQLAKEVGTPREWALVIFLHPAKARGRIRPNQVQWSTQIKDPQVKHTKRICTHRTNPGVPMEDKMVEMPSAQSLYINKTRITWIPTKVWHLIKPRIGSISKIKCSKCSIKTICRFKTQPKISIIMAIKIQIMFRQLRSPIWTTRSKAKSNRGVYPITLQTESNSKWTKKPLNKMHLVLAKQTLGRHRSIRRWWRWATSSQVFTLATIMEWTLQLSPTSLLTKCRANTLPLPR